MAGKTDVKIDAILDDYRIMKASIRKKAGEGNRTEMTLNYCNAHKHHKAFLLQFAELPEIKSIR